LTRSDVLHTQRQLAPLGACDQEQVVCELAQAIDRLRRRLDRVAQLLGSTCVAQRELELGPQEGEWRAQLMSRVGDEVPFPLERVLEPLEHCVQRVAEPLELVAGGWHGEPLARG